MNRTPCNNCIGNLSLFPKSKDTRDNSKPIKTSSSIYTNNKSSYIVANMKGFGRNATSKAVWGPGDKGQGKVDMKHGGYFRYIMRKRGMTIGRCGCN